MSRLDHNGVLNDYSVGQMERMTFDHAPPPIARKTTAARPASRRRSPWTVPLS